LSIHAGADALAAFQGVRGAAADVLDAQGVVFDPRSFAPGGLIFYALPCPLTEARHDLLLSELARASSSLRCAFQWLPSCRLHTCYMLNQLALGSLVLRGRVAAAFAQAVCIASIQVPPFAMVSATYAGIAFVVTCFAPFNRLQLGVVVLGQRLS
jgi:hypothetical protein